REMEDAARRDAEPAHDTAGASGGDGDGTPVRTTTSSGPALHLSVEDLVAVLGMDQEIAERAAVAGDDELLDIANDAPRWQGDALIELATGKSIEEVKDAFRTEATGGTSEDVPTDSDDVLKAIRSGSSRSRFLILDEDEEYAEVLEHGDFAA